MNWFVFIISSGTFGNYLFLSLLCFIFIYLIYVLKNKKILIPNNLNFLFLILFCVFYFLISFYNNNFRIDIIFIPLFMYLVGMVLYLNDSSSKSIIKIIKSISFGLFFHALLNYFTNIGNSNRNIVDFWTNTNFSATLQGTFVVILLSMFCYVFFSTGHSLKKIVYYLSVILSCLFAIVIGTRTCFIIFILVFFLGFIMYFVNTKTYGKSLKKIKFLFIIILFICSLIYAYNNNFFNIKYKFQTSNMYVRLVSDSTVKSDSFRFSNQYNGIISMIKNPFGHKGKVGNLNYVHNMWLDIGKDVGIIPFLFLFLYSLSSLNNLYHVVKFYLKKDLLFSILISNVYFGVFLSLMVEPILQGVPFYFGLFVIINAMVDFHYKDIKYKRCL